MEHAGDTKDANVRVEAPEDSGVSLVKVETYDEGTEPRPCVPESAGNGAVCRRPSRGDPDRLRCLAVSREQAAQILRRRHERGPTCGHQRCIDNDGKAGWKYRVSSCM